MKKQRREKARLDQLIATFEALVVEFPANSSYQYSLTKLQQKRQKLVDRIGRK